MSEVKTIDYFYNEQGDYTITVHDEPVAFTRSEEMAVRLKNTFSSLTMRIDVLSKMETSLQSENTELKADYADQQLKVRRQGDYIKVMKNENAELKKEIKTLSAAVKKFFFNSINPK